MDRVTKPQKKMLISLLRETKYMEGKKEKEWYWEKIQAALNTIGPKKTIIQWKKCWRDMRLTTRKKLAEMKRCQIAGGSPPPGIELNQEDNDIIDIVGSEYFYEEMSGELKPENFMTGFEYVPEQFCDAILSAAAVSSSQNAKDAGHPTQDVHDTDGGEPSVTSNQEHQHAGNFSGSTVNVHSAETNGTASHHPTFSGISAASVACGHQHLHHRRREAAVAAAAAAIHRESAFEEKLLQLMQDAFPKKDRKRKKRDPDKLFLLSLYEEMKKVPEEARLDVKAELIQVLKRYQNKGTQKLIADKSISKQLQSSDKITRQDSQQMHPQQQHPHSMYQLQKKYDKTVEKSDQQQTNASTQQVESSQRQQHSQPTRDTNDPQRIHTQQQISHSLFQMQKKYAEENDKAHQQQQQQQQQSDQQRKQLLETQSHTHQQSQQPPPPPPPPNNEQHLHHPQMPHGILFPLGQIRNEHPHQQQSQSHPHQQHHQHHPGPLFATTPPSAMNGDRTLTYENVG
ncbi:uncharacterized protein LOC129905509 isoform X2 [Episyrphus balteatus]|uniref:uncharacterized protein LOC129905509 isoform X2 n=1 Tax=Episyrphus balteatus TaxID=286459 RepID=UPI00248532F4|nr:uncharacterized protein LOC129905509 isoform X2 [Episyrphus balteatus]